MGDSEAYKLEKYLAEKAKQAEEQEPEPLSAYDACVLKESAKIHELIAEAQRKGKTFQMISSSFIAKLLLHWIPIIYLYWPKARVQQPNDMSSSYYLHARI